MNKIYKVMYSKVKQCCVVVSEIAKSHSHNGESSGVKKHAALTAAVLIALGSLSFTTAFVPMTAEAAVKTRTDGSNFVGVERTDDGLDEGKFENSGGKGANGADSITIGLKAQAGAGTITIGDRRASASMGSVYVGQGDIANPKVDTGGWATSIGYNSDATGYGSIALGSNAVAKNSYAKDSKGESLVYQQTVVEMENKKYAWLQSQISSAHPSPLVMVPAPIMAISPLVLIPMLLRTFVRSKMIPQKHI